MSVVCADRVSKTYKVYASAGDRLREMVFRRPRHSEFHALSDVSFALPRGRALGLIGENGAGKSTLLKIVAGTTRATSGSVTRTGRSRRSSSSAWASIPTSRGARTRG